MTGYMYNPSKKVSELLSRYLEFDPEQLSLGIWSGNLSLRDVSLREEAVYPILNRHLNFPRRQQDNNNLHYASPPLRLKLVSGTIGSLEMKIPWKRLVWGPGDVAVNMRNVVLVVRLESVQEADERLRKMEMDGGEAPSIDPNAATVAADRLDEARERCPWDFPGFDSRDDRSNQKPQTRFPEWSRTGNPRLFRELKQGRIRDAERRLLEGRWSAAWIEGVRRKDREAMAKLAVEDETKETEQHANSWLASATKDFFWRFCAGLVLDVENLKIVLVQDGIELGLIMPSIQLTNSKVAVDCHVSHFDGSDGSNAGTGSLTSHDNVVYQGADTDEGEHVDKTIKLLGFGVYIRRRPTIHLAESKENDKAVKYAADASTREFIIRPVDCSFVYSFFYPTPPEKRKRKQASIVKDANDQTTTTVASGDGSSTGSSKRRRGKRDKLGPTDQNLGSMVVDPPSGLTQSKVGFLEPMPVSASQQLRRASTVGASFAPHIRRQSIAFRSTPQRPAPALRSSSTAAVPLARPDNISNAFATVAASNRDVVRFESKLTLGGVELVFSSSHYNLLMSFLSSCARTRNGRPAGSIQAELDSRGKVTARSLLVSSAARELPNIPGGHERPDRPNRPESGDIELRLQLQGRASRHFLLKQWWLYALRMVIWELRERRRLRSAFQKRFLFFNWQSQQYKRKEYVELYIAVNLCKIPPAEVLHPTLSPIDELNAIEDEILIEQILLYRSIARAVFVRGGRHMPVSILDLRDEGKSQVKMASGTGPGVADARDSKSRSSIPRRVAPSFLSVMEKQGAIARQRAEAESFESLPEYGASYHASRSGENRHTSVTYDELTFAHTVDTRATRTNRQRALLVSSNDGASDRNAMVVSFVFCVENLDVVVIEEPNLGYTCSPIDDEERNSSESSVEIQSDVSVLTDDQRFYKESGDSQHAVLESEVFDDPPILSFTDFLIFNAPENVTLRVSISPLHFSLLARTGGARSTSLRIGKIIAFGVNHTRFFCIGRVSKPAPFAEVGIGSGVSSASNDDWGRSALSEALKISLVVNKSGSLLECDVSTIQFKAEAATYLKLRDFWNNSPVFPKKVLLKSPQEATRLYLLRQDANRWRALNSSIRFHGFEIIFPTLYTSPDMHMEDDTSESEDSEEPSISIRFNLIEVYSGTAVTALGEAVDEIHEIGNVRLLTKTRNLRMLDVTELMSLRPSILAHHWVRVNIPSVTTAHFIALVVSLNRFFLSTFCCSQVISVSGIDAVMNFCPPLFYSWSKQSFFENPVDLEVLWTINENLIGDFTRAKWEFAVRCSPVDLVISRERADRLCNSIPRGLSKAKKVPNETRLSPRLEVLSQFLTQTIDFRLERLRLAVDDENLTEAPAATSNHVMVRDILFKFLHIVSSFDLRYPNEVALASAMQLSIDRLTGLGLDLEKSWEMTNAALLNFLEECGTSTVHDEDRRYSAVERAASQYLEQIRSLDELVDEGRHVYSFVADLRDGLVLTVVNLYYDSCITLCVPVLLVTDMDGIHLLRVTPPEAIQTEGDSERSSVPASDASAVVQGEASESGKESSGLSFRLLQLDQCYPFGRGGEPLTKISADREFIADGQRVREDIQDVTIAEVELVFCRPVFEKLVATLSKTLDTLLGNSFSSATLVRDDVFVQDDVAQSGTRSHTLISVTSSSIMFVCDDDTPFVRLDLGGQIIKKRVAWEHGDKNDITFNSRSLSLLNLTSQGELYPEVLTCLSGSSLPPLTLRISEESVIVQLRSVRVIILQQFLSELLQFFVSENYGFGLFVANSGMVRPAGSISRTNTRGLVIEAHDSSFLLPRSSVSSDMVALEVDLATFRSTRQRASFVMPTNSSPFKLSHDDDYGVPNDHEMFSRFYVTLRGFRVLTALPTDSSALDGSDSLAFRFFYAVDGRAKAGKAVYCRRATLMTGDRNDEDVTTSDVNRIWAEVTTNSLSLDILIDKAPHLRILISDPLDLDLSSGSIEFDTLLSQFSLLLSIWYSNLQELPKMFPLTASQLESNARAPSSSYSFPDFGSDEFRSLLQNPKTFTSEIGILLNALSWTCSIDESYLDPSLEKLDTSRIRLNLNDASVHVTTDCTGVTRIGSGASFFSLSDYTQVFDPVVKAGMDDSLCQSFADLQFGLTEDYMTLSHSLSQDFQLSVFMLPGWSLYNLGMNAGRVTMSDLSSIFSLVDFLTRFSKEPKLGNPSFEVAEHAKALKSELCKHLLPDKRGPVCLTESSSSCFAFRLWLYRPRFAIPCDPFDASSPGIRVESEGIWYHYNAIANFASHEIVARDTDIIFHETCSVDRAASDVTVRSLVRGFSFGLHLNINSETCHTDVSFLSPFTEQTSCSLVSSLISVQPTQVGNETICRPFVQPERRFGPSICEVTVVIELMPLVSKAVTNFFNPVDEILVGEIGSEPEHDSDMDTVDNHHANGDDADKTFSVVVKMKDIRVFSCDPVLGPHLPVAALSIACFDLTASQFAMLTDGTNSEVSVHRNLENLQVVVGGHFWADYFKLGLTRSWEPLLEAFKLDALYEKSRERGAGLCVGTDSTLHVNVSGALLVILDEVVDSYRRSFAETFGEGSAGVSKSLVRSLQTDHRRSIEDASGAMVVFHEIPRTIANSDRVPFALRNMTGQELRLCKQTDGAANQDPNGSIVVSYVDHGQSTELKYLPSISVVSNMSVIEVEFPGLPDGKREFPHPDIVSPHELDVQLPGFHWIHGIKVDTFGRSFCGVVPTSQIVSAKADRDWRIANAMKLLVEVGLQNGGRQVTLRSLFSITNRTSHQLSLLFHPNPSHDPEAFEVSGATRADKDGEICPGETLQVPVLLSESALRQSGNHIGSIWIRPSTNSHSRSFHFFVHGDETLTMDALRVHYSSKPIQLAKLVSESAVLFENKLKNALSDDETMTGVHLSCPVLHEADRLAPFCYVVEVARSPLVKASLPTQGIEKARGRSRAHGPVAYSLSVHPTFVIVNLLPQKGRFELMHAVRRTVVWFADLQAGEQVSIHSVGLDAPLLLLINLAFCRTPVGEGALVHHGVDPPRGSREAIGLKTIGKAGKAVTHQIGKTLTKIGESPDKRGHERLFLVQNPQFLTRDRQGQHKAPKTAVKSDLGLDNDVAGADTAGGKTFRIDTAVFYPSDVAAETVVVDGIGQRLTLSIENVRGGGGQRRISVYSPFWIVNTTEHSLRYRQEKGNTSFVSGTVSSPEHDGSVPLEGLRAESNYDAPHDINDESVSGFITKRTVFSGMPGALATAPGRCDLPPEDVVALIDAELNLETLARLAFMFNFNEGMLSLGSQKLCVQLWDGTAVTRYASDWSQGLSLDSVGFSQALGMHCKDGRNLELTAIVSVAPGFLSGYTKIVRIVPRFLVINCLSYPIRLWQDSSVFRPPGADVTEESATGRKWRIARQTSRKSLRKVNQYEALWGRPITIDERDKGLIPGGSRAHPTALYIGTVRPSDISPFTLPDSRGERQLRVDVGGYWNLTASVSADVPGEHTVKVTRAFDLKLTPHISTRGSPEYIVKITPLDIARYSCELGIWFETDWGNDKRLVVKAVKKDSFAFQESDIHVGDELLSINGDHVAKLTFAEAMARLKSSLSALSDSAKNVESTSFRQSRRASLRLVGLGRGDRSSSFGHASGAPPLVLKFRTVEERLRRVRLKAARASDLQLSEAAGVTDTGNEAVTLRSIAEAEPSYLMADLRAVQHSYFLVLQEQKSVPYQIHNRSMGRTIYYRQRGCDAHPWQSLKPGQSNVYAWEEPLKAKRLVVRVALEGVFEPDENASLDSSADDSSRRLRDAVGTRFWTSLFRQVKEESSMYSPPCIVRLEEIGFKDFIPCQSLGDDDDFGSAKFVELEVEVQGISRVLVIRDASTEDSTVQLEHHLAALKAKLYDEELRLEALRDLALMNDALADENPCDKARSKMASFPDDSVVSSCHQILVEVIEANGLSIDTFAGSCNPYAEVHIKCSNARRFSLFKGDDRRRTYYISNTVSPTWKGQTFVFDVSPQAVNATRGYSVKVGLRDFRPVGQHKLLGSAQIELHSLRDQKSVVGWFPLSGRTGRHELENPLSFWGRGSVNLRLQWIYTPNALLEYFTLLTEQRVIDLRECVEGMTQQLLSKRVADEKKRDEADGFQKVRIQDILSRKSRKPRHVSDSAKASSLYTSSIKQSTLPIAGSTPGNRVGARSNQTAAIKQSSLTNIFEVLDSTVVAKSPMRKPVAFKAKVLAIESLMSLSRQTVSSREMPERRGTTFVTSGFTGSFPIASFQSWSVVQCVFRDPDLIAEVDGNEVKVRIKKAALDRYESTRQSKQDAATPKTVSDKFRLSLPAPQGIASALHTRAQTFASSRDSFEYAVDRKMKSVIHPGGWLVVRPLTALNLPEAYTGMFVKLQYGSEVVATETVSAKVNPSWDVVDPSSRVHSANARQRRRLEAAANLGASPNDLHVRVPPQKTSGSMILSVVGEPRRANIQQKTELGVLHLPLGSTIAACLDKATDRDEGSNPSSQKSHTYLRWFPLMSPRDVIPVEGDYRLNIRPAESEKSSDSAFHEYFAPCIQLALLWIPDAERDSHEEGPYHGDNHSLERRSAVATPPMASDEYRISSSNVPTVMHYFVLDIGRVSAALIDSQRALELVSLTASEIEIRCWTTRAKTRMGISLGWLQMDQQHDDAREPVILAPTPSEFIGPVIQILAVQDSSRSADIVTFDFIDVSLEEFDLTLEEIILFDLFDFLTSIKLRRGLLIRMTNPMPDDQETTRPRTSLMATEAASGQPNLSTLLFTRTPAMSSSRKVYIEQLFLGAVKVNLSYIKGKRHQSWELTSRGWVDKGGDGDAPYRVGLFDITGAERLFGNLSLLFHESSEAMLKWSLQTSDEERNFDSIGKRSQSFPQLFAALFPNISDAPIRLQGKALNHILESPGEILQSVQKYYVNETLRQVYRIIGSFDFVGNPTMLFTSFVSGVRDLVVTPSKAFMQSPTDASGVGLGVAQGTISLFSYSASGFFGFWAKVSAAAGQGLTWLAFDPEYRNWHRDRIVVEAANLNRVWKRRGVQSVRAAIARPVMDVAMGVGDAVIGVVRLPYKGYHRGGGAGLLVGIFSATTSIAVKPIVGVLDAMSHFAATIHDIAKSVNVLDRRLQPALRLRLHCTFGLMQILSPYDQVASRAVRFLRQFPVRRSRLTTSASPETLVHVELLQNVTADTYIIVSSCRIILVRLRQDASGKLASSLGWEVSLMENSNVSSRLSEHGHSGIALTVTVSKPSEDDPIRLPRINVNEADNFESFRETPLDVDPEDEVSGLTSPGANKHSASLRSQLDLESSFEGQYQGTTTGVEGELLEWYSVLAEYQHRSQLCRIHNAISCLTGNFSSVINDPSLGCAWSSEGYTSFGMFYFHPKTLTEREGRQRMLDSLEILPWLDSVTLEVGCRLDSNSQKTFLNDFRERCRIYEDRIEISGKLGGPEWLIAARADALDTADINPADHASTGTVRFDATPLEVDPKTPFRPSRLRRWATTPLQTIPDSKILETMQFRSPFRRESSANGKTRTGDRLTPPRSQSRSARNGEPSSGVAVDFGNDYLGGVDGRFSSSGTAGEPSASMMVASSDSAHSRSSTVSFQLPDLRDSLGRRMSSISNPRFDSFRTASGFDAEDDQVASSVLQQPSPTPGSADLQVVRFPSADSFDVAAGESETTRNVQQMLTHSLLKEDEILRQPRDNLREASGSFQTASDGSDVRFELMAVTEDHTGRNVVQQMSLPPPPQPQRWKEAEYEVRTRYRQVLSQDEPSRMDRMERLMENLLLYTSEQAVLQRSGGIAHIRQEMGRSSEEATTTNAPLQREIDLLHTELDGRAVAPEALSQEELRHLLSEVAKLRDKALALPRSERDDLHVVPPDATNNRDPLPHRDDKHGTNEGDDSRRLTNDTRDSVRESDTSFFPYASARSELPDDASEELGESLGELPTEDENLLDEPVAVSSTIEQRGSAEEIEQRQGPGRRLWRLFVRKRRDK